MQLTFRNTIISVSCITLINLMETGWLLPDKKIWIRQDQLFIPATVISRNDASKQVEAKNELTQQKVTQSFNACYQRATNQVEYEDMCNMNILNEPEILFNVSQRYVVNKIYTKIGPTLIALNPYKIIESLYEKDILMHYREKVKSGEHLENLLPHVYLTAGGAYASLKHTGKKQAIVISGESGAGKTENTKYCMKFLTSLSHIHHHNEKHKAIQDIILECNPILEAFGNSKTVRNSNSSRFGKYVRLFISTGEQMTGARIQNYLLEKSRVTSVSKKERSFHIFYYLINGADRETAGLLNGQKYEYLESSGCLTAEGIDDKADFRILKHSLEDVGFSKQHTNKIWMVLGAILLLGNLQFDNKDNLVSEKNLCKYADAKLAERICKNLGLKINELNDLLLEQKIAVGKEIMVKKFDKNQCITTKNTLAKALYGRVFDHLIQKINNRLWTDKKDDRSISILDIFGFEIFDKNSFEQLCINFTNERLQQLYTKYVFDNELAELKKDGLGDKVKDLVPPDNKSLIELIEKRMGLSVFSMIDEKTALGAAKDEDIVVELRKMKHKSLYVDPEPNRTTFMILHTQNPVVYTIQGFRYKNQDSVTQQIDTLINKLFPTADNQEFKGKTLVTKFDKQLRALNEELESSELHFIRCIKPNQTKKADSLDQRYVLQQIKYLGVLETIQIRKSAFPFRTSFMNFAETYKELVPFDKTFTKLSYPEQCMYILRKMFPGIEKEKNSYLIGKQRIYLKDEMEAKLNAISLEYFKNKNRAASKIQKQFQRFKKRSKIVKGLKSFIRKMKTLKRVVRAQIIKIEFKYFCRYKEQIRKIKLVEEQNKRKKKDQLERQRALKQQEEEQLKRLDLAKKQEESKKEQYETKKPSQEQYQSVTKSTAINSSKMYDTVVYDTQKPLPEAVQPLKPQAPQFKSSSLSQSYINHQSVVNQDTNILVKGQLRLPMYERNVQRITKLSKIITHSFDDLEENQKEKQDVELDISPSIDDKFLINSNTIKGELGHKIINFQYASFFQKTLRKRKTFFGRNKDIEETLKAKDGPISKSLILLPEGDEVKAIEAFKLLLWIADSHKTEKIYQPIEKLIELMQNTSQNLRNQVFVQIIKQQNVQNQYSSIKMYQIMAIYLHIFRVEENFIFAYLSCLLERFEDPRTFEKIKEFITYLFARSLRHITSKETPILYLPTQFQLAALMCKRQIPVSVYFSIGNCIIVKVESFETLADIKERVMETAGINSKRILPQMIGFFEVMSFQNQELEEIPLDDNRSVWDLMTYWDKAKGKFEQTNVKPPDFGLYLKIKFAYELTFDDEEGVQLFYAQAYFDLFLGRLKIPLPKLLECSAMMKASEPDLDIDFIIPLWAVEDNKAKEEYLQVVNKIAKRYQKMTRYQIRFEFLRNCNSSNLFMAITFPTQGNTKLFVKPKRIYIVENDEIIEQIGIRRVLRWGCDQSTLMLTVRDSNSERVMTIKSEFAKIVGSYLSTSMKLIMAMKGNP